METIERIKKWLSDIGSGSGNGSGYGSGSGNGSGNGSGYGNGNGSGSGSGSGSGYGYGSGSGNGYGYGNGNGSGSGYGSGYGYGYGDGNGYGSGSGSGYGSGYGSGNGLIIKKINNDIVFMVDSTPTIINYLRGNIAKGFMVNLIDFSTTVCWLVKNDFGLIAHGKTLKEAHQSLLEKELNNISIKDRISKFKSIFNLKIKYSGKKFFDWHHILTGSCLMGREQFVKQHNLDLNKKYTVKEFIELCKNDYGRDVIQQLKVELQL